jgi:sterol desaturase/sphingolipid hydroxylase (fatty acid hydroxylase superfamily)
MPTGRPANIGAGCAKNWKNRKKFVIFFQFIIEYALCYVSLEVYFYFVHRLFHIPALYAHFHRRHHEWIHPVGSTALYAHPIEVAILDIPAVFLGQLTRHPDTDDRNAPES